MLQRLLKEPFVHFVLLGAGLFAIYFLFNPGVEQSPNRIVVDDAQVGRLAEGFRRTWMRPPTQRELDGLVEDHIMEEILYREAVALGLDQNDLVIRRRMRQKMEFLNSDLVDQQPPTEAELQAYLEANPEKFRFPELLSFQQIYLNPEDRGSAAHEQAEDLVARLNSDPASAADSGGLGDMTLLPQAVQDATPREITSQFGRDFGDAVSQAPTGEWSGPIESGYGLHVVLVTSRQEAIDPTLDEARTAVEREWSTERRKKAEELFYQAMRDRYTIEIQLEAASSAPVGEELAASQ